MGDFNINLLHYDTDIDVQTFIDTLSSQTFYPTVSKPTRITDYSATLIDNIITNDFKNHTAGVLITDISDHLPVFVVIDSLREKVQDKKSTHRARF